MSSLIEQAARRLEQLRQAGALGPDAAPASVAERRAASDVVPLKSELTPEQSTGAATSSRLIELDLPGLAALGFTTPNDPRSLIGDQYRVVKRPLIRNATGQGASPIAHGNLIMVTSALAGEGKTFTSVNLAMSIAAELDHTVMLVDADVARPSVLGLLGQDKGPGLLDILDGQAKMSDVLLRTNVDKLTILPSGNFHPRATELLSSDSMRQWLDDVSKRYSDRIVIFDSPPLLLTTEARVLATHMGQVVVVVQAGKTLQSHVEHALAAIESCPVRLLLLNQARASSEPAYGYGYGYGYGSGYGAPSEKPST